MCTYVDHGMEMCSFLLGFKGEVHPETGHADPEGE
jgi:hypothetical protein